MLRENGQTERQRDGCIYKQKDGWMDGWKIKKWKLRYDDGWMDGCLSTQVEGRTKNEC